MAKDTWFMRFDFDSTRPASELSKAYMDMINLCNVEVNLNDTTIMVETSEDKLPLVMCTAHMNDLYFIEMWRPLTWAYQIDEDCIYETIEECRRARRSEDEVWKCVAQTLIAKADDFSNKKFSTPSWEECPVS